MNIINERSNLLSSNTYAIIEGRRAILVDVCCSRILYPFLRQRWITVDHILLTHEHYDHISGANWWKERFPEASLLCSEACAQGIRNPRKNLSRYFEVFCQLQTWIPNQAPVVGEDFRTEADQTFRKEYHFSWMGHNFCLQEAPGHSPGSILVFLDDLYLFSGDTLFEKAPISTVLYKNGQRDYEQITGPFLETLPMGLTVYPGHFEPFVLKK